MHPRCLRRCAWSYYGCKSGRGQQRLAFAAPAQGAGPPSAGLLWPMPAWFPTLPTRATAAATAELPWVAGQRPGGPHIVGFGKKRSQLLQRSAASLLWYGITRAHPDLNQGPADLQSAALTTELCTRCIYTFEGQHILQPFRFQRFHLAQNGWFDLRSNFKLR